MEELLFQPLVIECRLTLAPNLTTIEAMGAAAQLIRREIVSSALVQSNYVVEKYVELGVEPPGNDPEVDLLDNMLIPDRLIDENGPKSPITWYQTGSV